MTVSIALFTRDLRTADNPVLTAAHRDSDAVVPLFVVDDGIVPDRCPPNRAVFLATALAELDERLRGIGGRLVVRRGEVTDVVARIAAETGASAVHLAEDVSAYATRREQALRDRLAGTDCAVRTHSAFVTAADPAVLTPATGRDHYAVFTPYFRRWVDAHQRRK